MADEENHNHTLESGEPEELSSSGDIFSRPSGYRLPVVRAVWEKAPPGPEPDTRHDWRNGVVVGPWKEGESRAGIWDMGHIVAWYKVVEELKKVDGITRKEVLDEFNNLDNLGVEDPVTNRELGIHSRIAGVERLPEPAAEAVMAAQEQSRLVPEAYRAQISKKEANMKERIRELAESKSSADDNSRIPGRIIIWDTETTGLSPARGDKLVDIAAIELVDGQPSGREFHQIINPERDIPFSATRIHGIDNRTVRGKPAFRDIADSFLAFIGDAPLVAHNARFDLSFLNAELEAAGKPAIAPERSIDSLRLARALVPEAPKYDLDSLAEHLGVDYSIRHPYHGALRCSTVLKDIFLKLEEIAEEKGVPILAAGLAEPEKSAAARVSDDAEQVLADERMLNGAKAAYLERVQEQDGKPQGFAARERIRQNGAQKMGQETTQEIAR